MWKTKFINNCHDYTTHPNAQCVKCKTWMDHCGYHIYNCHKCGREYWVYEGEKRLIKKGNRRKNARINTKNYVCFAGTRQ